MDKWMDGWTANEKMAEWVTMERWIDVCYMDGDRCTDAWDRASKWIDEQGMENG